jgi:hypothetical protein
MFSGFAPKADMRMATLAALRLAAARCFKPPRQEAGIMRYELSDDEWATIRPMLPNKARGVPRVDDRRGASLIAPHQWTQVDIGFSMSPNLPASLCLPVAGGPVPPEF